MGATPITFNKHILAGFVLDSRKLSVNCLLSKILDCEPAQSTYFRLRSKPWIEQWSTRHCISQQGPYCCWPLCVQREHKDRWVVCFVQNTFLNTAELLPLRARYRFFFSFFPATCVVRVSAHGPSAVCSILAYGLTECVSRSRSIIGRHSVAIVGTTK